ncbi:hypothetical protein [Zooshikella sp. RANM57]|uniref:hypothetical protein n=1 Tax=Zooshikella sp. RANM57 TaxID=3425863 RepID=UPI003D6E5964
MNILLNIKINKLIRYALSSVLLSWSTHSLALEPLNLYVRMVLPTEAKTVQDAAEYLISHTGYQLKLDEPAPTDAQQIASNTIKPIARMSRTMSVMDSLLVLIGPENYLIVDREHKLLSFTAKP